MKNLFPIQIDCTQTPRDPTLRAAAKAVCAMDRKAPVGLSDQEREAHIRDATHLMEMAWAAYEMTGCLSSRGAADQFRIMRDEAIRARSPAQVRRMEIERGLA
jgi:hypothetical protein